jgi:hypothetical protein
MCPVGIGSAIWEVLKEEFVAWFKGLFRRG